MPGKPAGADANNGNATMFVPYTGTEGARFDRDYYVKQHLPLVMEAWGLYGLETATALFLAGDNHETIAICICRFRDEASIGTALGSPPQTAGVMADVGKFTDVKPTQSRSKPI